MAFVIPGRSICRLCGARFGSQDDVVSFPAFIPSTHPLATFSDGVFHRACFLADARSVDVELLYARYRTIWDARPRDLKTLEEINAWGKEAFKNFP